MGHSRQDSNLARSSFPVNVAVLAFNNCLTSSVVGMLDVFQICNTFWKTRNESQENYFDVKLTTTDGDIVYSFNGLPIQPTHCINDIPSIDIIIIPPIMSNIDAAIKENGALIKWLSDRHSRGSIIASVCTGAFFIAASGLLTGQNATTNPLIASFFQTQFPDIKLDLGKILVDEQGIITSGPTYAFVDLFVYIVEKYCSEEIALQCAKLLLHDKNRSSQLHYFPSIINKEHNDEEIKKVQSWLEQNSQRASITIEAIAHTFHMSPRNFVRRFRRATGETPLNYLQKIRIDKAKKIMEISNKSINEITQYVGYTDSKSFGRLFRKHTGNPPIYNSHQK